MQDSKKAFSSAGRARLRPLSQAAARTRLSGLGMTENVSGMEKKKNRTSYGSFLLDPGSYLSSRAAQFVIVALLLCRLHRSLLTGLPPRWICHRQRSAPPSQPSRCAHSSFVHEMLGVSGHRNKKGIRLDVFFVWIPAATYLPGQRSS